MDDHKNRDRSDTSNRMPSLLASLDAIGDGYMEGIVPNPRGKFERDTMFRKISPCLRAIPIELHGRHTNM